MGNLQTPEGVQRLRTAVHAKAKEEPGYRFYLLYDKVYRDDLLRHAYRCCQADKGAAGMDGQKIEDIEAYGEERRLGELAQRLRKKDYRPEAVKRVPIPEPNGKLRPLGIPTITDRVVQTAAMVVLEPIFEADLQPEQYGYRPDRGDHDSSRVRQKPESPRNRMRTPGQPGQAQVSRQQSFAAKDVQRQEAIVVVT